jgi:hypothetical protein
MSEFDKLSYSETIPYSSEAMIILHMEILKENYFDKF